MASNGKATEKSDGDLVAAVQAGDVDAFNVLVLRYQDRIYNLARKYVYDANNAFDVAQTAFVNAFKALKNFRKDARFSTWLYRIAVNEAINFTRKQKKHAAVSLERAGGGNDGDGGMAVPDSKQNPEQAVRRTEAQRVVQDAIRELPDEYRIAILLRDIEQNSYEDIAEILDVPIGTVRSRIHRARLELKEKLKGFAGTLSGTGASNE